MKVNPTIRNCVVFIGLKMADDTFRLLGTGLIANYGNSHAKSYLITAKHIINGIKNKLLETVYLRLNLKNGTSEWYPTDIKDWVLHEDFAVDVAILQIKYSKEWDHLAYRLKEDTVFSPKVRNTLQIDIGDELFIVGLFRHHHGKNKNIPIIRVGNICSLLEEKIQTEHHLMDGYLIEARSTGGLSGSPVFLHISTERAVRYMNVNAGSEPHFFLLGIIYGHYDDPDSYGKNVNTGIAIVTPVDKIMNLFLKLINNYDN
jgi:hypothetical protein